MPSDGWWTGNLTLRNDSVASARIAIGMLIVATTRIRVHQPGDPSGVSTPMWKPAV